MEKPELEKIIKKLEEVEIQRWKYAYIREFSRYFLFVETNGLRFSINERGKGTSYSIYVECAEEDVTNNFEVIEYSFDKKNKGQRELVGKFYEKTLTSLREYKEKGTKEKINNFLLD